MGQKVETIIIGGGQAGLSTSYHLSLLGREHIVLEQATQAGNAWRNDRWGLVYPQYTQLVFPAAGCGVPGSSTRWLHAQS